MPIGDYSTDREANADIAPGNIRAPAEHSWAQQIINSIRQLMADLATGLFGGGVSPTFDTVTADTVTVTGIINADGGQIAFPTAQNASVDANTLDDYEEGTFTPTVTSSVGTFTTVSSTLWYTKIGNRVLWTAIITITNKGTVTGDVRFTLPFASAFTAGLVGRENAVAGYGLVGVVGGTLGVALLYTGGTPPIANGHIFQMSGNYRI